MFILGFLLSGVLSFAQVDTDPGPGPDQFSRHVALTGAFTRNIDGKYFVKEVRLENYSTLSLLPSGIGLKDGNFADNGQGYDLKAGDGIYTSQEKYEITKSQKGNPVGVSVLVMNKIIADQVFEHDDVLSSVSATGKFIIKCHFYKCGCPCVNFTCNVCQWWGWSCIAMDECHIEWQSN